MSKPKQTEWPVDGLADFHEVTRRWAAGWSRPTLQRKEAEGKFPRRVVLSRDRNGKPLRVAWSRRELIEREERLLSERAAE